MINKARAEDLRLVANSETERGYPTAPDPRQLAIQVEDATLQYPIGPLVKGSLKSALFRIVGHKETKAQPEYVDAVRGISFNITHGERVALIGMNGSGKSTLLRALAGIYPLRSGDIRVVGQIGTLLDIALGFEIEATGRENIYYRGMALGLSRRKIRDAEQEIVDFAGLGEFIDLPMRTYSAGMYVRLGFAVSTQFSPDILLVDEVFGAGDAGFAQKAVARMLAIVQRAGIVVIATHDMELIHRVCTRAIWLSQGVIMRDGPPSVVVPQYLQNVQQH